MPPGVLRFVATCFEDMTNNVVKNLRGEKFITGSILVDTPDYEIDNDLIMDPNDFLDSDLDSGGEW